MLKFKEWLHEGYKHLVGSSSILPATRVLTSKNKVHPLEVGPKGWGAESAHHILIGTLNDKPHMIVGFANPKSEYNAVNVKSNDDKVSKSFPVHHQQTFRHMGDFKVHNHIVTHGDKILHKVNDHGLHKDFKAPFSVFK